MRTAYTLAAAVLLAWACALSGSRGALLYALWFALLGAFAGLTQTGIEAHRLKFAAYGLAGILLAAQVAVPWLNDALQLGPANQGAFERLAEISSDHSEVRWLLWRLAWHIFANAPIAGVGIGEFAGAAFSSGLPPGLTQFDDVVFTSPHNLVLQLLAETGALGAFLALGCLCTWWWQAGRRYFAASEPVMWWIIAAVGIEMIHSMVEFPLWNTHFLGVTALLMGLATRPGTNSRTASRFAYAAVAGTCVALTLTMAMLLRDYVRLNATSSIETPLTRAGAAAAERDAAVMRSLTRGPLAPAAEYRIILGASLVRAICPSGSNQRARNSILSIESRASCAERCISRRRPGSRGAPATRAGHANISLSDAARLSGILTKALAADPDAIEPLLAFVSHADEESCD